MPDEEQCLIDWTTLTIRADVPEKHAVRVAWKLAERGGPYDRWHPRDILSHFDGMAVKEKRIIAIFVSPAFFNGIHRHLHGFTMSVFGEMTERKPVWVAGYRLEPSCVLQSCNPALFQSCNLAELQN